MRKRWREERESNAHATWHTTSSAGRVEGMGPKAGLTRILGNLTRSKSLPVRLTEVAAGRSARAGQTSCGGASST